MKKIEDQKSWTPPTTHLPNKEKISGSRLESEIQIKYKRIKWTPRVKASLLSSQGDNPLLPKELLLLANCYLLLPNCCPSTTSASRLLPKCYPGSSGGEGDQP